tara:strand:+ start:403 stop:876 length:474 start_codon:yes stop_codon:yes gene_type:complete
MNIFVLHLIPSIAAIYHCDKHVVKMILEYAQIMCTIHRLSGDEDDTLYRKTHQNHPACVWARKCTANYNWLYSLFCECCKEYTYRYGKVHKTQTRLMSYLKIVPENVPYSQMMTPFAECMPDYCKEEDPVSSYRNYYLKEKSHILKWKSRDVPEFVI